MGDPAEGRRVLLSLVGGVIVGVTPTDENVVLDNSGVAAHIIDYVVSTRPVNGLLWWLVEVPNQT